VLPGLVDRQGRAALDVRNIAGKVSDRTIYRIASLIEPEIVAFCAAWRKHHGHY
jgi:hypothetical protein